MLVVTLVDFRIFDQFLHILYEVITQEKMLYSHKM